MIVGVCVKQLGWISKVLDSIKNSQSSELRRRKDDNAKLYKVRSTGVGKGESRLAHGVEGIQIVDGAQQLAAVPPSRTCRLRDGPLLLVGQLTFVQYLGHSSVFG